MYIRREASLGLPDQCGCGGRPRRTGGTSRRAHQRDPVAAIPVEGLELSTNPIVRKISFTGSTRVGKRLMSQAAGTVKNVSIEFGGNAPFIVFDDADIDAAVEGAIESKYRNTGQTCICANRIYVQDAVYDVFAKKLADAVAELQVGPGLRRGQPRLVHWSTRPPSKRSRSLVEEARNEGAAVLTGGKRHDLGRTFYEVTMLTNVTQQ